MSASSSAPLASARRALLLRMVWQERGVVRDLARLALAAATHPPAPSSHPQPVLICPGYLAGDRSTVLLRRRLDALGHTARSWGLGTNTGDLERLVPRAAAALLALREETGQPVALIGWSLGGVITRQLARLHPDAVAQVITLGTPLHGLKGTAFADLYTPAQQAASAALAEAREQVPLSVPLTVLYTRRDSVVHWESSLDHHSAHAHHVEVDCTHSGLVASASALQQIAAALDA